MTVRPIRVYGDPILRARSTPVTDYDTALRRLVEDLSETLADAGGSGLAAPQIGVNQRVFVYVVTDSTLPEHRTMGHLVNPVIVEESPEPVDDEEGCLSIPGLRYRLERSRRVVAEGFDLHGEHRRIEGSERLARCLAHETDHLDGVLFVDRLDPDVRRRALREIRELLLAGEDIIVKPSPHGGLF